MIAGIPGTKLRIHQRSRRRTKHERVKASLRGNRRQSKRMSSTRNNKWPHLHSYNDAKTAIFKRRRELKLRRSFLITQKQFILKRRLECQRRTLHSRRLAGPCHFPSTYANVKAFRSVWTGIRFDLHDDVSQRVERGVVRSDFTARFLY